MNTDGTPQPDEWGSLLPRGGAAVKACPPPDALGRLLEDTRHSAERTALERRRRTR